MLPSEVRTSPSPRPRTAAAARSNPRTPRDTHGGMPSANRGRHPPSHAETRKANHAEPSVETHSCVSPSRQTTPRRKRQTRKNPVETHSCVSASRQVFAAGDFIRQSRVPRRENASLQLFAELTNIPRAFPMTGDAARHVSTNQTTPRRKRQTTRNPPVETHSCVSASRQVFAAGDFIRQSCVPRRENASLQLFAELTNIPPAIPMTGDAGNISASAAL